ncbi:MAG: hypothetical protein K8H99_03320 [Nitrospirae bacterium]|nr:hypothetical protein [Fimbriimonadaceae bacterium]
MTEEELRQYLMGTNEPLTTLDWLRDSFLPQLREELRSTDVRRRLGIYEGERIPENERNLTDVRNRVSLILEYEMARIASRMLEAAEVTDLFWCYVVANRFPDLEVRDVQGHRGLRIEVKCLQTIAEEKSANFDTLRKDINPNTDFLAVFLWEWAAERDGVGWDRAPYVLEVYVFHCSTLAALRDGYWLNNPPKRLGEGLQGFDLRFAVNCTEGQYKEEEGNYGKLLRIWKPGSEFSPPDSELMRRTISDYTTFKQKAILSGVESLAKLYLPTLGDANIAPIVQEGRIVGWSAGRASFVLKTLFENKRRLDDFLQNSPARTVYVMTEKYSWCEYGTNQGNVTKVRNGAKPKFTQ